MRGIEKDIEGLNDIIIINEFLIPVCNAKEGFRGFVLYFNNLSLCPIIDLFLEGAEAGGKVSFKIALNS